MALRASCKRNVAGRGDHDGAGQRHGLHQRDHDIARARRQIDDEVVELSPLHLAEKLLDDGMQHRPAPHQRLVARTEKSDRHHLQPVTLRRQNAIFADDARRHRRAQHQGNVGPIHVGIEQPDLVAHARQRDGQVHRQSGFADAALA